MNKELLKKVRLGVLSFAAIGLLAACSTDDNADQNSMSADSVMEESVETPVMEESVKAEEDIVGIAQGNPDFSILVSALQEADLVETLQGEGPFTVFAPTNAAFEKLLGELDITADELLAQPDLAKVLTYHVVPGKVLAADLTDGMKAETVNGEELMFDLTGDPMVNESMITSTDIEATNGVVHVIDTVLVPSDFELQEDAK
ncbi:fasciclin domain-containing protein [Carnobacterium sp.]|uniref:fasciclin domain-containing protein n=1 Tax=Carnobacterium sp. TaxID=48221 RepID=UPI003C750E54